MIIVLATFVSHLLCSCCMMPCSAALALIVVSGVTAQFDGNPHGWDRKRRCDHTAYEPPCGVRLRGSNR